MNDENKKTRESTASQQACDSSTPSASSKKDAGNDGCKTSTGDAKQAHGKEPSDGSSEKPNARPTGDKPSQPIEGQRRDQGPQGSLPVGEEDKRARADQSPGYSPFRPQAESKAEVGDPTDRSAANRSTMHQSDSRPAGEKHGPAQHDEHKSGHKTHDAAVAPMKGADAKAPKPTSPATPVEKSTGDHKRGFEDTTTRK